MDDRRIRRSIQNTVTSRIAAHFFIINRRYEEGIELYRKALDLDPTLQSARSDMGVNLMRLGLEEEARKQLEQCYNEGYQSPETVNSLRLLDSYKDYVTFKTPTTILRLNKKEANLLRPYFQGSSIVRLRPTRRNTSSNLTRPVQLEVYPNHEDFAVRTVGMPGLGALGVTFGYAVAMDSPSGRKPGNGTGPAHVARTEPRLRARDDESSGAALVHRRAWRCTRKRRVSRLGRSSRPRPIMAIK